MDGQQQTGKRQKTVVALSVLLVIAVGVGLSFFVRYQQEADSNPLTQQQELTVQLGRLIELPPETPVVSTVLDKSKLTSPALAGRAHNGDALFIFPKSKRLVLYRPSDKKVVDMLNIQ